MVLCEDKGYGTQCSPTGGERDADIGMGRKPANDGLIGKVGMNPLSDGWDDLVFNYWSAATHHPCNRNIALQGDLKVLDLAQQLLHLRVDVRKRQPTKRTLPNQVIDDTGIGEKWNGGASQAGECLGIIERRGQEAADLG